MWIRHEGTYYFVVVAHRGKTGDLICTVFNLNCAPNGLDIVRLSGHEADMLEDRLKVVS